MTTSPASSASEALDHLVAANLAHLRERIANSGAAPEKIRIVAVTKGFAVSHVEAAARAGLRIVGENYADELKSKHAHTNLDLEWCYLGALQTNKIAGLSRVADLLAGVARVREIETLARQDVRPPVYVELNCTKEPQRNGVAREGLGQLLDAATQHGIEVRGLMTIAPTDEHGARQAFVTLVDAANEYQLVERSMGMSDDFELACALGATEIRIGRLLFGPRPGR